ncbi:MAG: lactonase family protein [Synechococcaceae cyanobacterium SM2_3_2]|nr:lactonase family protein [Synechococcaceae cyanobacterium SM2_3_2]
MAQSSITGELVFTLEDLGGAEMLAVSADGTFTVVAGGSTVTLVTIEDEELVVEGTYELTEDFFPENSTEAEFTGLAISPDGSFLLAAVKDSDEANTETFDEVNGKVLALSLPELEVLGQVMVGRGPDSVAIAPQW